MEFQNKTVIITGGASGMGALAGECFAKEGANVVLCDINDVALAEKCEKINALGIGRAVFSVCDVRNYEQITKAKDMAIELFGSIDVLINFAGGQECRMLNCDADFPNMPLEVFDWGIDVNLKGPYYFAHAVIKQMMKQRSGVIINIGSIAGIEGGDRAMAYSMAKSGLMYGLTRSLAMFGAPHGIRCVCVSPGPVLTRASMAGMKTPAGRASEPQEIVDVVMFMASDKASSITGSNHMVDLGRSAWTRDN